MSTIIQYKGNTLTTVSNATKTLKTAGKYMEGDVVLTDVSGGSEAISVVDTLDANGGTIRTITAVDISDTTAVASDVARGKYFYTADGTKTTGTSSGGGGSVTQDQDGFIVLPPDGGGSPSVSGLEYEEGTFTPSEETGYPTIPFAKNHDTLPTMISLTDIGEGFTPTGTTAVTVWQYYDAWKMVGHGFPSSSNTLAYSYIDIFYVSTSGGIGSTRVATSHNSSETGSDASYPSYYVSTSAFMPYTNGTRYYKAGRTYKWIAVWAPTT